MVIRSHLGYDMIRGMLYITKYILEPVDIAKYRCEAGSSTDHDMADFGFVIQDLTLLLLRGGRV